MPGTMRRAMTMLGLASDTYDDESYYEEPEAVVADVTPITRSVPSVTAPTRMAPPAVAALSDPDELHRISTVRPKIFRDAKLVGEPYRDGVPVIMNLTDSSDADARRLVDFASGMVLALGGKLEKITQRVFLLSPASVEVVSDAHTSARSYDED